MSKIRLLTFLFAALIITSLSGCRKDDDAEPRNTALLTAGQWVGAAIFMNGQDVTQEFRNDEEYPYDISQHKITFNKVGTYLESYEGVVDNGTWELQDSEKSLLVDKGTYKETTYTIEKISNTELFILQIIEHKDFGTIKVESRYLR